MAGLNRRDFLKALGVTSGASVVSACGFDQNYYRTPIEDVIPYVVRPEQVIPGNPVFFASTASTGPAAYPVLMRHRDGRVINVGANPESPFPPGVSKASLLELQRHYSPDRTKRPVSDGADAKWEDALSRLGDAVKAARASGKKVAYLGPYRSGAIVELINAFTDGQAVFYEPLGREAEAAAAERLFGTRMLPAYDLSKAHYVLSFGADFLTNWSSPVYASQYAQARDPNRGGFVARFAMVSPHQGQTGANADDWHAVVPGTEALVAYAVAKLVASKVGYNGPLAGALASVDVAAAIAASGLTQEAIDAIVEQFQVGQAVALPGGVVGASKAAVDLATATYVLNIVAGASGSLFGAGPAYMGPVHGYDRMEQLIADMKGGTVGVLLIDDHANPLYALPIASGVAEGLAKVDLIVALSSHPDETNAAAKLVLPTSDTFEDWGDEEPQAGLHLLRQPAMTPLNDTRSLGDILLATARGAGIPDPAAMAAAAGAATLELAPASPPVTTAQVTGIAPLGFAPKTWLDYLKARWARDIIVSGDFNSAWDAALAAGFVDARAPISAPAVTGTPAPSAAGAFDGAGAYYLIAYSHPFRMDGRYANEPWAQEVSDPMTGQVWDSWVEINPATADKLGLQDNDLVEIATDAGKIQLGVERYPGVREDVIAIAFGNGHEAAGRYAQDTGQNVAKILAPARDGAGGLAWQSMKAGVALVGKADLASTFGGDTDLHRSLGVVVPALKLAEVGDAPADEPGSLTGIEEGELDERLQKAGITDFYGLTEHPTYRFGLTVDVNACTGCGACAIACYAENNLPVVGKTNIKEGREMSWLRVARYYPDPADEMGSTEGERVRDVRFVPMMCQQCGHAPCESVCPVLATYHTIDGLNAMVYNRCVGTRYCANNCPYGARRFNWHSYVWPEPFNLQLNPEATVRTMGVMEKCTFCVQRIRSVKSWYRTQGIERGEGFTNPVPDSALQHLTACAEACPSQALTFGNLNDTESVPSKTRRSARNYLLLADLNTFPAVNYLGKATFHPPASHHGDGTADAEQAPSEGASHP